MRTSPPVEGACTSGLRPTYMRPCVRRVVAPAKHHQIASAPFAAVDATHLAPSCFSCATVRGSAGAHLVAVHIANQPAADQEPKSGVLPP